MPAAKAPDLSHERTSDDKHNFRWIVQLVTSIAVGLMLPVSGFFATRVIENGSNLAVLSNLLEEHSARGTHSHAVHQKTLDAVVLALNKQLELRGDAIRRELSEIKESLRELREQLRKE